MAKILNVNLFILIGIIPVCAEDFIAYILWLDEDDRSTILYFSLSAIGKCNASDDTSCVTMYDDWPAHDGG